MQYAVNNSDTVYTIVINHLNIIMNTLQSAIYFEKDIFLFL